jgi:hypothetical protein
MLVGKITGWMLLITFYLLLTNMEERFVEKNKSAFRLSAQMVEVDRVYRKNIAILFDQVNFVSRQGQSYYTKLTATPEARAVTDTNSFIHFNGTTQVIKNKSILEFQIDRYGEAISDMKDAVVDMDMNVDADTLSKSTLDVIFSGHADIPLRELTTNVYNVKRKNNIKLTSYLRNYATRGDKILLVYNSMLPYMQGKEPPYSFPMSLRTPMSTSFAILSELVSNSFGGVLTRIVTSLQSIKQEAVFDTPSQFNKLFWLYTCILCGLLGLYCVGILVSAYQLNRELSRSLCVYKNLRPGEAQVLRTMYGDWLSTLSEHQFDEEKLIEAYLDIKEKHSLAHYTKTSLKQSQGKQSSHLTFHHLDHHSHPKTKSTHRTRPIRIKKDFASRTLKFLVLTNTFLLAILSPYLILIGFMHRKMNQTVQAQKIYFDNYLYLTEVGDSYLANYLLLVYGNFLKVDGKFVSEYPDYNAAIKLVNYWVSPNEELTDIFTNDQLGMIRRLMTDDLCPFMPNNTNTKRIYKKICQDYLPMAKGVGEVLRFEYDTLLERKNFLKANFASYLESSKRSGGGSPNLVYLFSPNLVKLRLMHDDVIELFIKTLFKIMFEATQTRFEAVKALLIQSGLTAFFLTFSIIILQLVILPKAARRDVQICTESFNNIDFELFDQNSALEKAYKRYAAYSNIFNDR